MTIYTIFGICAVAAVILTVLFGVILKKRPDSWLLLFFQQFAGSLFIFSGLVKAVDPWGTAYKMEQYFAEFESAFGSGLGAIFPFFAKFAFAFAIIMLVLELVLGIALIFGLKRKFTSWAFFVLLVFFTVLTGFTYLTGYVPTDATFFQFGKWGPYAESNMKVTDCGCFGDFLKLKPQTSFFKDVLLLPLGLWFVTSWRKLLEVIDSKAIANGLFYGTIALSTLFCLQNSKWNLPMADFRPFAEGINLPEAEAAALADEDVIEQYLAYKNMETGEEVEINADDLGKSPHLWKKPTPWKAQTDKNRRVVIKEGSTSKLRDFQFSNEEGMDISDEVVAAPGYQFMVVSYNMDKANRDYFKQVNEVAEAAEKDGHRTFGVTQIAATEDVDKFRHELQAAYPFFTADDILLKTIIRSNPGVLLLKDGTIIEKWHGRKLPDYADIKQEYIR